MSNENKTCSYLDDTIVLVKKHLGKLGVVGGVLGVICSTLVGLKLIVAGAIVMGVINLNLIIGSVAYERLQAKLNVINDENESLKIENRRLTLFQAFPNSQSGTREESDTPSNCSDDTVCPDNFDSIYHGTVNLRK